MKFQYVKYVQVVFSISGNDYILFGSLLPVFFPSGFRGTLSELKNILEHSLKFIPKFIFICGETDVLLFCFIYPGRILKYTLAVMWNKMKITLKFMILSIYSYQFLSIPILSPKEKPKTLNCA